MIKVLYVHPSLDLGGAQAARYMFLKFLSNNELDVRVCCLGEKGIFGQRIETLGYKVDVFNRPYHFLNLLTTFKLYQYIKAGEFDVVHSSLFFSNYHSALAVSLAKIPLFVIEEHGEHKFHLERRHILHRIIGHYTSKMSSLVLSCSDSVKKEVSKAYNIPIHRIEVLKNMIYDKRSEIINSKEEIRKELRIPSESTVLGTVASLGWIKNHKFLINCFAQLDIKNLFLVLVGDGPLRDELMTYVSEKGLDSKIRFTGWREDVADILNAFDIFVLVSINEGFPISLLEAMSIGLPCIATCVGGVKEILEDNITGILISLDNKEELIGAIKWAVHNREAAIKLGIAARNHVLKYYQPSDYVNRIIDLYKKHLCKSYDRD